MPPLHGAFVNANRKKTDTPSPTQEAQASRRARPGLGGMGETPRLLMGRYELGRLLGKGSFAKVYHARKVGTKEEVAIKVMDKDRLSKLGAAKQQIMREIDIMRRVRHPHVVRIHEVMATRKSIFVVMEFVGGGSLVNTYLIHRRVGRGISEALARRLFQQLVSALDYCHTLGVYHRDIKPDNILIDATGNIKIADFGLSALAQKEALLHTVCGTPMYIAPEVFLRCGYHGAKADVWACGIILFALVAGRFPFNHTSLYHMIHRCDYRCPPWFSTSLTGLIRHILCHDPARRITIRQMKENRWFKKDFKEIPRSLSAPELCDSDSDFDNELTSSSTLSGNLASLMVCSMRTSVSAPSLTTLESAGSAVIQDQPHMRRPKRLNAFDIITSSPSLDLSGLLQEPSEQMQFVSVAPVSKIISKLEEIAGHTSFTTCTKECQVSIEDRTNRNQSVLLISAKIYELTPELLMVKVRKKAGDNTQYWQFCNNELKPGLRGLVDGLPEENADCMTSDS